MKLKKIVAVSLSAMYAASMAAAVHSAPQSNSISVSVDDKFITESQYEAIKQFSQSVANREGMTPGPNQHLARSSESKQPFNFEPGLSGEHTYIIQLDEQPLALYNGNIKGFAATKSAGNNSFNSQSSASLSYKQYLQQRQSNVMSEIVRKTGTANSPLHSYQHAYNGLSLKLTQAQASQVAELAGVKSVVRSRIFELQSDVGPEHIGADRIWQGQTSVTETNHTGAGVIVGILDTGVNSAHPSFSPMGDDGVAITNPFGSGNYVGDCEQEAFAGLCNDKLIGVRSYPEITDTYGDPVFRELGWWASWERARPANGEDYNGHGSHTASTAAGNVLYNVPYQFAEFGYGEEIEGRDTELTFDRVSGVAPHANIISYQVCWAGGAGDPYAGCPESVTLKAIDDAIADGVQVINFSVGGAEQNPWQAPVELAFLAAREANISVSASAGNASFYWMDHVSPWLTSVAATTHSRALDVVGEKRLENFEGGESNPASWGMSAKSVTGGYTGPIFSAAQYDPDNMSCDEPFAEGTFANAPDGTPLTEAPIITCGRSDQPRVTKSDNIKAGGAGGFILYNTQSDYLYGDSLAQKVDDYYSLPAAHIGYYDGGQIASWLETGTGHRVTITDASLQTIEQEADALADFSSRGPSTTNPNVMAPTVAAPGVDVFAAYANDRLFTMDGSGQNWAMISGTSMAAPHVAGAMALLKNAHPDWTDAEIQSALTTTTTPAYVSDAYGESVEAHFDHAGAGVINVGKAIEATLLLDESVENYIAANPLAGGDETQLNTPYLVNRECQISCTWFRTVTATEDGTWTVSAEEVGYQGDSLMKFDVTPAEFSLSAGESQRILVTVSLPDVDYQSDSPLGEQNTNGLTLTGKLMITPAAENKPVQTLPVIAALKKADLPVTMEADFGRDEGEMFTPAMTLPGSEQLTSAVYLAKGEDKTYHLSQNTVYPYEIVDGLPDAESQIGYRFFTVPTGTKRLVVEIKSEHDQARFSSRLDIGRDVNNDELIDWDSETICISDWRKRDYCAINNPEPGRYWYMVSNLKWSIGWWDPYDAAHEIVTSVSVISNEATDMVSIPELSGDGVNAAQQAMQWSLPDSEQGDVYYGLIELGSDSANTNDIGSVPLRLTRSQDDVMFTSSHTGARAGDIVEFEIIQQANLNGQERDLDMTVYLPEGFTLIADSLRGNEFTETLLSTDGQKVMIQGAQPSSKDAQRRYEYTTSLDDPMCRLPFTDAPMFLNLPDIGVPQVPGFETADSWNQMFEIPDYVGYDNYYPHIPLYGVEAKDTTNIVTIEGDGLLRFDAHALMSLPGYTMEFDGLRDLVMAPFWRANASTINESGIDFATFTPYQNGVYAASLNQGAFLAVQWKKMRNVIPADSPWGFPTVDDSTTFDFELIASSVIDFTPGAYEVYYAYNEMAEDTGQHTVGLKGYQGTRGFYYPVNGYHYDEYAINEGDKLGSNLVVCANYQGPESTRVVARFAAKVNDNTAGTAMSATMTAAVTGGNTVTKTIDIPVSSNITVFEMSDMTIEENTSVQDLVVEYINSSNRAIAVSVSGDNVSAEISGDSFTLTPAANWHGSTEVTVTVSDAVNSTDASSTSFMLTVNSDGVELGCTDSSATNHDSSANTDDGSCAYAAEVSTPQSSSGGSMSWVWLTALSMIGLRRRG